MPPDDQVADQLNAAIDALLSGAPAGVLIERLPAELHGPVRVGSQLAGARRPNGGAVGPTFLLGLEEQLRTDFRLQRASGPARAARRGRWAILLVGPLMLLGLFLGARRAGPTDPLYGLKRGLESVQLTLTRSPAAQAGLWLGYGARRLDEAGTLLGTGGPADVALGAVLDDLVAAYAAAFGIAAQLDDPWPQRRAETQADLTIRQLAEWETRAAGPEVAWIRETRQALEDVRSHRAIAREAVGGPAPPLVPAPSPTARLRPATLTPAPAADTATPTATGMPAQPTVAPTRSVAPPAATATPPAAPTTEPAPEPTREGRPRPTDPRRPTPTPAGGGGGGGPTAAPPTKEPTPDCWNEDCKTPSPLPNTPVPAPQPTTTRDTVPDPVTPVGP